MPSWLVLIIIIAVILIAWWAMTRSAKTQKPDFEVHTHEEPAVNAEPLVEEAAPVETAVEAAPETLAVETSPGEAAPYAVEAVPAEAEATEVEPVPVQAGYAEEAQAASKPVAPVEPPAPIAPDDLATLEGIGPRVNAVLHEAGILTFADLAAADPSQLKVILAANGMQYMDPASWPDQAALAAEGKHEDLSALQSRLKGGRRVK